MLVWLAVVTFRVGRVLPFERIGGKAELLMKTVSFLALCWLVAGAALAQQPLSRDEALKQLYHEYDAGSKTAQWVCTSGQTQSKQMEGWPCSKDYATVTISEVLMAEVEEDGVEKVYVVTSAAPDSAPGGYDCHACAPAVGMAVFAWKTDHWDLQSANAATGFYAGWGVPPEVGLAKVGPDRYGVLLSSSYMAQGYASSSKTLLLPVGSTVTKAWSIGDEEDDLGAYDPTGKDGEKVSYRSSAAIKFVAENETASGPPDYYDIEVISRGEDSPGTSGRIKQENWTEVYRFGGGKYTLLRHTDFVETKKAAKAN
jgi:hypothetical protein